MVVTFCQMVIHIYARILEIMKTESESALKLLLYSLNIRQSVERKLNSFN